MEQFWKLLRSLPCPKTMVDIPWASGGAPETAPRFEDLLGLLGLSMWSCSPHDSVTAKGYKAESAKRGNVHGAKSGGNQAHVPRVLPVEPHRTGLIPPAPNGDHAVKCCLVGKLTKDPVPGDFTGCWSHRHPLPNTSPNSRLPDRT